jgi:hypothetical protein
MPVLVTVVYVGPAAIFVVLMGSFDAIVIAALAYLLILRRRDVPRIVVAGRRRSLCQQIWNTDRGCESQYGNSTTFELHLVLLGKNCSRFRPIRDQSVSESWMRFWGVSDVYETIYGFEGEANWLPERREFWWKDAEVKWCFDGCPEG